LKEGWPAIAGPYNVSDEIKAVADALSMAIAIEDLVVPANRNPEKVGDMWPEDYDLPTPEELGIELPPLP